ncbi:hypothetical protein [Szabonella alba]|uniref:Uncharacterized protein n=1 Tax=Szabonella alba TaxID=2804194 RepID=A0A8K0VCJ9_9RHOB|nr:hypothetical protein [Szabonella alba]MBL4917375.1 hypothetical protein [Szabonella alba]
MTQEERPPTAPGTKGQAPGKPGAAKAADTREGRLRAALKANMARRKAQARARSGDNDTPGGADHTDSTE